MSRISCTLSMTPSHFFSVDMFSLLGLPVFIYQRALHTLLYTLDKLRKWLWIRPGKFSSSSLLQCSTLLYTGSLLLPTTYHYCSFFYFLGAFCLCFIYLFIVLNTVNVSHLWICFTLCFLLEVKENLAVVFFGEVQKVLMSIPLP